MEYKFINQYKSLGKETRKYLREVSGYKRLPNAVLDELILANNLLFEEQEQKKKSRQQAFEALPEFVERDEAQIKQALRKEQKKRTISQFENNLRKSILQKTGGSYSLKLNSFLRKFSDVQIAIKQMLKSIEKILLSSKKINLKINNQYYALNANTIEKLYSLMNAQFIEGVEINGSDTECITNLQDADSVEIFEFIKTNKYDNASGDFFKYNHIMDFDFSKYQIYKIQDVVNYIYKIQDAVDYKNCLIYALKQGGLSNEKLEKLRLISKTHYTPISKLNEICDKLEIQIKLKKTKKGDYGFFTFGEKHKEIYNIGLLEEHYFILDEVKITSYAIKNYNEIKHINEWNKFEKRGNKSNKKFIDSFSAIRLLLEFKEDLLVQLSKIDIMDSPYYKKVEQEITNLNYEPKEKINYKAIEPKEPKVKPFLNIFYDFETHTDENGKHIPYLVCYRIKGICHTQYGTDCGLEMLWHLSNTFKHSKSTIRLIAHNGGKYDSHFIFKYLYQATGIKKGMRFMTIKGKFNETNFELRDSLLLITMPLKSFNKTFKLGDTIKEVISYNMYNKTDCIKRKLIPINEGIYWVKNDGLDEQQFLNNIKKWNLQQGENYDCVEYSRFYCEIDCEILEKGYTIFKKWMQDLVKMNIDDCLTLASLAHNFFINEECYEGVNELSGTPQQFIQKCVVGGRVMCCDNKKTIENQGKKIMDFDAVSLYPSAMARMEGYLKGLPKVINNLDYNSIRDYDGYFLQIIVKSVGINRKFPNMSFVNDEGIRVFTNEMVGKTMFIDKIALEDAIKYHNIDFEVIRGYYFDEGFNTKINETIQHIFNERKKLKAQKNPAETVYKLIMNSAYGKTILKEIETEIRFFNDEDDMNVFISRNYNWIQSYEQIDNSKMWVLDKINPINDHFNIPHIGVSILSMSKRIMNEVMGLAEDNNLEMFYQDTDSIHISKQHIEILAKLFEDKYDRKLIGEDLGQFHSDFELTDCKNVYASRSIFLGKKCYIDELKGLNAKGEEQTDYHIRMKGIPNSTIKYTAKNLDISVFELYERLFEGENIKFDLTEGGGKANFKVNKNGTINTLPFFERTINFI